MMNFKLRCRLVCTITVNGARESFILFQILTLPFAPYEGLQIDLAPVEEEYYAASSIILENVYWVMAENCFECNMNEDNEGHQTDTLEEAIAEFAQCGWHEWKNES